MGGKGKSFDAMTSISKLKRGSKSVIRMKQMEEEEIPVPKSMA